MDNKDNKENLPIGENDMPLEPMQAEPADLPSVEEESGGHPFITAFLISLVAILVLCLCWYGFFKLIHKDPIVLEGDRTSSISMETGAESEDSSSSEAAESASSAESEDAASESASSEAQSKITTSNKTSQAGGKKQFVGTQQAIAAEPRLKEKTETWADRPIEPDEFGYYGVLYAPGINTEEPIFFGDEQKFLDAGWGQQTDTFLVGYECAHLFWTDNEQCVQEMQWMYPGLRFQIETDSGIYVYEVEVYANGHWAVNPDRRDVTEYRIYNNNHEELADIYTTYDVLYLAHEKEDGSVDVVEAHLVI